MNNDTYRNDEDHGWDELGWLQEIDTKEICTMVLRCAEVGCRLDKEIEEIHDAIMAACIAEQSLNIDSTGNITVSGTLTASGALALNNMMDKISGELLTELGEKNESVEFAAKAALGGIEELKNRGVDAQAEMKKIITQEYDL